MVSCGVPGLVLFHFAFMAVAESVGLSSDAVWF